MTTSLKQTFTNPPRAYGILPFWFWNDDLEDHELIRQIHEFHSKGFGGFLIHPRVGLSRRVGYLTPEFFRLVRLVVEEAAQLGMKVVLYDEGSYPSGSAAGQVVARNPDHASRCIIARQQEIVGPAVGYWHPNPGRALNDELLAVVAGREVAPGVLDPSSLTLLPVQAPELVRYELGPGNWRLIAIWHVHSGGTIRGVFAEQEDGNALAPAAGDILNPDAVASFIDLTHNQYYAHLQDHFGSTVVAMFTDEPMVLGRGARRGPQAWPFTPGFLADAQIGWPEAVTRWLPALWLDCGARTENFRQHYTQAVHARLERVFYGAQGQWCADHGIALTGHPAESNDFAALRHFQWPGQDMVWRWVTPSSPSALEGPHSCAPKCASSAAILQGSARNGTEVLGAYGWQLTLDESKWLLDWHLVRGNNLFFLHAAFYSVHGRRAYESEPDIGLHNLWWPYFALLGDYLRRLCWLLAESKVVCRVAVLTDPNAAAWAAAKVLFQNQIDFLYVDVTTLAGAQIDGNSVVIGQQHFDLVICDPPCPQLPKFMEGLAGCGVKIVHEWQAATLVEQVRARIGQDLDWPNASDLRVLHLQQAGQEFYLLVNEGEAPIEGALSLAVTGGLARWNPLDGTTQPWPATIADGRTHTQLRLERRESTLLVVDPTAVAQPTLALPPTPNITMTTLAGPWQATNAQGDLVDLPCPGDWAQTPGWETFAGRVSFSTTFVLTATQAAQPLFLDLGQVGDIAEVLINGKTVGVCAWAPYRLRVDPHCQAGTNQLTIHVTNTIANFYEGLQRPSGLLGPVEILTTAQ